MNSSGNGDKPTSGPRVFVSHSHKDEIYVRKIVDWLDKVGCSPWASFEECSDKYRVEIDGALLTCDVFLLIATKNSFASDEVKREVTSAGALKKPISYYKLDDSSHMREGFLTILAEKQYIQASKSNLELKALALNIFETWDGNRDEQTIQAQHKVILDCLALENANYLKWREKLWSFRLDANNSPRNLSSIDRDMLQKEADRLGLIVSIEDENQAFALDKRSFTSDLVSIIAKRYIDESMLAQIERKRLDCSVSMGLASSILNNRLGKINYLDQIIFSDNAAKWDHWLVAGVRTLKAKKVAKLVVTQKPSSTPSDSTFHSDTNGSDSFVFKHKICYLEHYENDSLATKMHAMSMHSDGTKLVFRGIKGLTPFSCSTSIQAVEISIGRDIIKLSQEGIGNYILISIDKEAADFGRLLEYLKTVAAAPVRPGQGASCQGTAKTNIDRNGDPLIIDVRLNHLSPSESVVPSAGNEAPNGSISNEPDSIFGGCIVAIFLLVVCLYLLGQLYQGLVGGLAHLVCRQ